MPKLRYPTRREMIGGGLMLPLLKLNPAAGEPGYLRQADPSPAVLRIAERSVQLLPPPALPSDLLLARGGDDTNVLRLKAGREERLTVHNELSDPVTLYARGWRGSGFGSSGEVIPRFSERTFVVRPERGGTCLLTPSPLAPDLSERGMASLVIIEQAEQVGVDQDVGVLLKDFRLTPAGAVVPPAGARLGNAVAVNGRLERFDVSVRRHERLRLRLANASSVRILVIEARGFVPRVMALDGAPCEVFEPAGNKIVLPPGGRADLLVDINAEPAHPMVLATRLGPVDLDLVSLTFINDAPLRQRALEAFPGLPNPAGPRLDLAKALRVDLAPHGQKWRSGQADTTHPPHLFSAARGRTIVLVVDHAGQGPATLHSDGAHLRPLDGFDDGVKPWLLDTILLAPGERLLMAFVAERSGLHRLYWRDLTAPYAGAVTSYMITG